MRFLLILNILLIHFSYGQQNRCDSLFNRFKKDIQVELRRFNQVDWDIETKESYYTLMINCSTKSLMKYVEDSVPAIRGIIFSGLAQKNAEGTILSEILSKHINDSAKYIEGSTDVKINYIVSDYMKTVVKWKLEKKLPNPNYSYQALLERVREEKNRFRIIIPGIYHGTVPKESLLALDSLACSLPGYRVISFYLTNGNERVTSNNIFIEKIKELIMSSKSGDLLQFGNLIVEDPDKLRKKAPSLVVGIR